MNSIAKFCASAKSLIGVGSKGKIGQQVIYVPTHLKDKIRTAKYWTAGGIQPGFIFGVKDQDNYWIRYWLWDEKSRSFRPELRTKANSELTPAYSLYYFNLFDSKVIEETISELKEG